MNELPVNRRDELKFNLAMCLEILDFRQYSVRPAVFPIPHQRSLFGGCSRVVVERRLLRNEFAWIEDTFGGYCYGNS